MRSLWHMVTTSVRWLISLFLLVCVVVFGLNNSHSITVDLSPTPYVLELPVFILFFVAVIIGVVMGSWTQWRGAARKKNRA